MGWGEQTSAELEHKAPEKTVEAHETGGALFKKRAIVLDMGEASREQGFRLNGCR